MKLIMKESDVAPAIDQSREPTKPKATKAYPVQGPAHGTGTRHTADIQRHARCGYTLFLLHSVELTSFYSLLHTVQIGSMQKCQRGRECYMCVSTIGSSTCRPAAAAAVVALLKSPRA